MQVLILLNYSTDSRLTRVSNLGNLTQLYLQSNGANGSFGVVGGRESVGARNPQFPGELHHWPNIGEFIGNKMSEITLEPVGIRGEERAGTTITHTHGSLFCFSSSLLLLLRRCCGLTWPRLTMQVASCDTCKRVAFCSVLPKDNLFRCQKVLLMLGASRRAVAAAVVNRDGRRGMVSDNKTGRSGPAAAVDLICLLPSQLLGARPENVCNKISSPPFGYSASANG